MKDLNLKWVALFALAVSPVVNADYVFRQSVGRDLSHLAVNDTGVPTAPVDPLIDESLITGWINDNCAAVGSLTSYEGYLSGSTSITGCYVSTTYLNTNPSDQNLIDGWEGVIPLVVSGHSATTRLRPIFIATRNILHTSHPVAHRRSEHLA